jgi:cyclic pyranopterin phosphate synthase
MGIMTETSSPLSLIRTPARQPLIDPFGRAVTYLRISVTDRCDLRCRYCMAEDMTFLPRKDLLSLEELTHVANAFIDRGVTKIRVTGGEPLHRRGIVSLMETIGARIGSGPDQGLEELTLTTNATRLHEFADDLVAAGVRRVNVSLDTLRADRFQHITRRGDLAKVIHGMDAAKAAGLRVKVNTVALRGINDDEVDELMAWCGERGFDLTFIETMPLGVVDDDRVDHYMPLTEVRNRLARHWTLTESTHQTGGPARYMDCAQTGTRLGFITPLSHNFCEGCNRVRLTCTGTLYLCLGQDDSADLRAVLRSPEGLANPKAALDAALDEAIGRKPEGHDFIIDREHANPAVDRHMSTTGG